MSSNNGDLGFSFFPRERKRRLRVRKGEIRKRLGFGYDMGLYRGATIVHKPTNSFYLQLTGPHPLRQVSGGHPKAS